MNLRMRHIQRRLAPVVWLWLALLVVGPTTPHLVQGAAAVLCIGTDGHVEVEAEHDQGHGAMLDIALGAGERPTSRTYTAARDVTPSRDCIDIPFVAPDIDNCLSATLSPKLEVDASFAPVALAVSGADEPDALTSSSSSAHDAAPFSPVLPAHRSVVLLI